MLKKTAPRSGSRIYGYARVSTLDQDLTIQHAALEAAGCMTIFEEKKSGTRRDGRTTMRMLHVPELQRAMGFDDRFSLKHGSRRYRIRLLGTGYARLSWRRSSVP